MISANQCLEHAANELEGIDHQRMDDADVSRHIKVSAAWQTLAKTINREQTPEKGK